MNYLQSLLDGSNMPFLSAFILGLMTAISPCPMATNITAIAYIGKNIDDKRIVFRNGIIYTLGRAFSYTFLGILLFMGFSKFHISSFFQANGERFVGPMLFIIGIFMLGVIQIKFPGLGKLTEKFQAHYKKGNWLSAFLMGVVFALAFCPYSGALYFVILIPMSITNASGLFLPPVFALATGLPVIVFAYLIAYTLSSVGRLYNRLKAFEKWFRKMVAILFILVGLRLIYVYYIQRMLE
jgi:cytochrome c-type biogenesis protein